MSAAFWQESVYTVVAEISRQGERWRDIPTTTDSKPWHEHLRRAVAVYADGGVFRPRRCEAGSWAWVAADQHGRRVAYQRGWMAAQGVLRDGVTNNLSEFAAMLKALEAMAAVTPGWSGRVCSDSEVTIGRFCDGWRLTGVPVGWERRMRAVLGKLGSLQFVLLKGHPTPAEVAAGVGVRQRSGRTYPVSEHQVLCDTLCTRTINEWSVASGIAR